MNKSYEYDIGDFFRIIWAKKISIIAITFSSAVLAIFLSFLLPVKYTSEAILAPAPEGVDSSKGLVGQLGGLASLAGVDINKGEVDRVTIALELLKSRGFLEKFISRHDLSSFLLAFDSWSPETNKIEFDKEIYDPISKSLLLDWSAEQVNWVAVNKLRELISIEREPDTGLVYLYVSHQSPNIAQQIARDLINDINYVMRNRDIEDAKNSISYLESELKETTLMSMQQVFYGLVEQQLQTVMLANSREEYVLRVIEPPVRPLSPSSPFRILISLAAAILAFIISILWFLGSYMRKSTYSHNEQ